MTDPIANTPMDEKRKIVLKAREKYIKTGTTKNITLAVLNYLRHDATEAEQAAWHAGITETQQLRTILQKHRPRCPTCETELGVKFNVKNSEGVLFKSALECKVCDTIFYLNKTPGELADDIQNGN
ncbi:hypothetical protein LCGC14_0978470 [marine sediment metagenome]|uniref:Uncharacterized protein n=1 Tax=marine sediment metagenome TaxID=412755 RepID=A0A0F9N9G8_9ZZZZ